MIETGNLAIQDSMTKRDIDLNADWGIVLLSRQRVDVSMVFVLSPNTPSQGTCDNRGPERNNNVDVEWQVFLKNYMFLANTSFQTEICGTTFRHIL